MGGFWKNFILVHVLVRSLCSALSALCTSILPGGRTVESRFQELSNQDSLQSICFGAKVSEKMMQWRGGFRMLFVVFHRFSQGFHGSRALKNTMEFQYLSSRRSKYYKLLRWLPGCKTQEFLSNLMAQSQLSMLTPDRSPRSDYDIKIHAK